MSRARELFQRRILAPLLAQLSQGVTPAKLAMSTSLGVVLSIIPVPGTTTLICLLAAAALRLNPVAMQVANFVATPLAIATLLPFIQLGQRLFGAAPLLLTRQSMLDELSRGTLSFLLRFGGAMAHAVVAWALIAPLLIGLLQLAVRPLFARACRLRLEAKSAASSLDKSDSRL